MSGTYYIIEVARDIIFIHKHWSNISLQSMIHLSSCKMQCSLSIIPVESRLRIDNIWFFLCILYNRSYWYTSHGLGLPALIPKKVFLSSYKDNIPFLNEISVYPFHVMSWLVSSSSKIFILACNVYDSKSLIPSMKGKV